MAISVMTWVWNHSRSRHGARLTLLAIADSACDDGSQAWPSVAELKRKTGLGERAVQTALAELVTLGELAVDYNAGPKGCNRYRVIMVSPGPGFSTAPAESAPPQNLHPAESAPPQKLRGSASSQAKGQTPAEFAPPAESAPPQISTGTPAESAPGSIQDPSDRSNHPRGRADIEAVAAKLATAGDDDDPILRTVIDQIHARTGRVIPAVDAARVAAQILDGRRPRDRAAYVRTTLSREPDPLARFGLAAPLALVAAEPTLPETQPSLPAEQQHLFSPDGDGRCSSCGLPESNRHHRESA